MSRALCHPAGTMDTPKKRGWIWAGVGIVLLGSLLLMFGPGRAYYRQFKERRSAAQAETALQRGDGRNALLSARQTLLLNPTNLSACRVMATLAEVAHSPTVLEWQRRIAESVPTPEHQLQLAAASLRYENAPFPIAQRVLTQLANTRATNFANFHLVAAELALKFQRWTEAETQLQNALGIDPTNQLFALNLAVVQLNIPNSTATARSALEQLQTQPDLRPLALRALVADCLTHGDPRVAATYSAQLLADPRATEADRRQQLTSLKQLADPDFNTQLQAAQQRANTNLAAISDLATWLQASGLIQEKIHWLKQLPGEIQNQSTVRIALADAYLANHDWSALRDLTAKPHWGEAEFLRLALAARAWFQMGVTPVAESNWGAAVNEAGQRLGALKTLLNLADQWQLEPALEVLLQRITEKFPREKWAQLRLEKLFYEAGKTAALRQVYTLWLNQNPTDINLKNNLTATCLLLNTNLPQAYQWAAENYQHSSNNLFIASTYAFALHQQHQDTAGLKVLELLKPEERQQPAVALYYGVLLEGTGQTEAAKRYFELARQQGKLLPEERQLLKSAQGQ